jgi:hypothetical protein
MRDFAKPDYAIDDGCESDIMSVANSFVKVRDWDDGRVHGIGPFQPTGVEMEDDEGSWSGKPCGTQAPLNADSEVRLRQPLDALDAANQMRSFP